MRSDKGVSLVHSEAVFYLGTANICDILLVT